MPEARRTPEAFSDLSEIWVRIALDNVTAADRFLERLKATCDRLGEFPSLGRERPELADGLRSFPVGDYIIFYRRIRDGVEIIRVLRGARRFEQFFRTDL